MIPLEAQRIFALWVGGVWVARGILVANYRLVKRQTGYLDLKLFDYWFDWSEVIDQIDWLIWVIDWSEGLNWFFIWLIDLTDRLIDLKDRSDWLILFIHLSDPIFWLIDLIDCLIFLIWFIDLIDCFNLIDLFQWITCRLLFKIIFLAARSPWHNASPSYSLVQIYSMPRATWNNLSFYCFVTISDFWFFIIF